MVLSGAETALYILAATHVAWQFSEDCACGHSERDHARSEEHEHRRGQTAQGARTSRALKRLTGADRFVEDGQTLKTVKARIPGAHGGRRMRDDERTLMHDS
jgi:hypothetical protein